MKKLIINVILFLSMAVYAENADYIVDKKGNGDFTNIQDALNKIPADNSEQKIILVKNGVYEEKLFIESSNIALVGESKDSVIIKYAMLRKNWMKNHDKQYGASVVNIGEGTENVTLANLTVWNNYGTLYGDNDHQYAIYGMGTKVILLHCNVIADGADTISLWPEEGGMFYHSHCYFEGHVDYVCPRGWCYITDSKFYGHNMTATLWHKGIDSEDAKFVINDSYFDGKPGFPLGRHHYDAQFYLLNCVFSENMADLPIFWPESPNAHEWKWGERHYYYNCQRIGGDYDWFADNLETAKGSPKPEEVTAKWTFNGKWDPEGEMPSVLPFAFLPIPQNGEYLDESPQELKWIPSRNAESFNVYFWKSKYPQALKQGAKLKSGSNAPGEPIYIGNQKEPVFKTATLEPNSTWYWRIDEVIDGKPVEGKLWHFTIRK